jgi:AmpD protein
MRFNFSVSGTQSGQANIVNLHRTNPQNLIDKHCLTTACHKRSPNYNQRPNPYDISLLVIHNISLPAGEYGNGCVEQLFTNCLDCRSNIEFADLEGLEVSAHLLIDRQGIVTQFVPFDLRAWHAGQSSYCGRDNCNDYSIGVELEGVDDSPYTERQYQSLIEVTQQLLQAYPKLNKKRIVGHSDIAPNRKTDPGPAFDWAYYLAALAI